MHASDGYGMPHKRGVALPRKRDNLHRNRDHPKERCFKELEALRRETGWVGARNPLGRLIRYLRGRSALLVNYARPRALNLPVSSAGAESVVDYLIGQRLKRDGHMRWTREGANSLLQVRCAALKGLDVRNFKRWYPGKQFAPLPRARLLS